MLVAFSLIELTLTSVVSVVVGSVELSIVLLSVVDEEGSVELSIVLLSVVDEEGYVELSIVLLSVVGERRFCSNFIRCCFIRCCFIRCTYSRCFNSFLCWFRCCNVGQIVHVIKCKITYT
ncbi:MAG TPA: hypothetical protein OIL97_02770 [Oscillospiraceae bacterium]|nr:hypothetical protein [Oscillospiraceae bacterium]